MATYTLVPLPRIGITPEGGMLINTYAAGTSTPIATYTDSVGSASNTNPVVADGLGLFPAIYLPLGTSYKFVCTHANGVTIWTQDGIASVPASTPALDVPATAGETLLAGVVAYCSDGSGGKQAGLWYIADNSLPYSSTTPLIGIPTATIASGSAGSVRFAGTVTGLTGLLAGSYYYVGTAGALTITQPTNARVVGFADSTSTLILDANPGIPNADNGVDDFRLTLTTGVPVTIPDVTAATSLFCTPYKGNRIALFDSNGIATILTSAQFTIAVPATASTNYDIFAFNSSGVPTLELNAWRNSGQAITGATNATPIVITANAHGLSNGDEVYVSGVQGNTAANATWTVANISANTFELSGSVGNAAYTASTGYLNARASTGKLVLTTTGTYTKTADLTRRYLGSFRTTTVSGQTEDSATKRFLWNNYNRVGRRLLRQESTASWTYNTSTWRQANAATANKVEILTGIAERAIDIRLVASVTDSSASAAIVYAGIGEDSTSILSTDVVGSSVTAPNAWYATIAAAIEKAPAPGYHSYVWIERGDGSADTVTWRGFSSGLFAFGLVGSIDS